METCRTEAERGPIVDHVDSATRSRIMASVQSKNTRPELQIRRLVHGLGYRYRLHSPKLPGKPDLVFPSRQKVIFVHGCFWHAHSGCRFSKVPKTRTEFWKFKQETNAARDRRSQQELQRIGWKVLTVWQCELRNINALMERLNDFLSQ